MAEEAGIQKTAVFTITELVPTKRIEHVEQRGPPLRAVALPEYWRKELDRVLISEAQIKQRVSELAAEIQKDYRGRDLVMVALLNGTVMFLADLIRNLELPLRLDFIGVSSYGSGTESGRLVFTKELRLDVRKRHVLLVDDILDTGKTLARVSEKLQRLQPASLSKCVLLEKNARRLEPVSAEYVGFQIPNEFVVGYGLDYAEQYRNLPFLAVLQEHIYRREH
jgi:hypoxanthine phosphoribosyltransferase